MAGFVAGLDRGQATLLPACLEDWVDENNSVRAVDVFVEALDLREFGFEGVDAAGIGLDDSLGNGSNASIEN
jgi:transposase